jgi:hypothetical protein
MARDRRPYLKEGDGHGPPLWLTEDLACVVGGEADSAPGVEIVLEVGEFGFGAFVGERAEEEMHGRFFGGDDLDDGVGGEGGVACLATIVVLGVGAGFTDGGVVVRQLLLGLNEGSAEEVGAEGAGLDGGDADVEMGELEGHGFGETFDGELGGIVNAPAGQADEAADGGEIDDVAALLPTEMGEHGAGDAEKAEDVGFVDGGDFGVAGFLDSAEEAVAGIVDQDVDAAEAFDGCFDHAGDVGFVVEIHGDGEEAVGGFRELCGDFFGLARGGDDGVSTLESGADEFMAEALGGAGDEPDERLGGGGSGHGGLAVGSGELGY